MAFTGDTWTSDLPQIALVWRGSSDTAGRFQSVATTHWELVVARVPGRPTAVTLRGPETRVTPADLPAGGAYDPWVAAALRDDPVPDRSPRTRQRRIVRATGLSPVTIRQIHRADRALGLLGQGRSILDTVHETGYFDQSHLTHSLKRWFGLTPAQVAGPAEEVLGR